MIIHHYYRIISLMILLVAIGVKPFAQTKLFENQELNTVHNYRITQDHDGYIWMIGEKGITKYDGNNARIFTTNDGLPTNDIWNIRITDDNKVWFFSSAKEHGYILNDSVYKFPAEDERTNLNPMCIVQEAKSVGFYNDNRQLIKLERRKWVVIDNFKKQPNHRINSGLVKSIILNKDTSFIESINGEKIILSSAYKRPPYFNIYPGNILFLVIDNTIQVIELNTLKIHPIDLDDYGLNLKYKIGISYLNHSYQLTGLNFVLELDSNFSISYMHLNDSNLDSYYSMKDKLENIWITSFNNGVYFKSYSETKSITHSIGSTKELKIINGDVFFIKKKKSFGQLKNNKISIKYIHKKDNDVYSYSLINNKIHLFSNVANILDSDYNTTRIMKLNNVKEIFKTDSSFYAVHRAYSEELDLNFDSIINFKFHINGIKNINDTLFFATNQGLYYRYKNELIKHPVNLEESINSLAISKKKLIIGTDGHGLFEYVNGKMKQIFSNVSFVEKIKVYHDSIILAATNQGLYSIINKESGLELKYIFNINDGLKTNLVNDVLLVENKLHIATAKGITTIGYEVENKQQLQAIYVNNIKWNGEEIKDSILKVNYKNNNSLEVNFSTINYTIKSYLKYSYKLSPGQSQFIEIPKGQINLNNLPIGKHKLIIKVENDKNISLTKEITIEIKPNWYQTILFKFILGCILLLLTLIALRNYKNRVSKNSEKKINQERQLSNFKLQALRSQMNPHFVFNSLNAIQYYMNENDLEMSDKYLLKFSRLIRQFFDLSNVTEISLNNEIELLSNYLEIEKMRFRDKLEYEIIIDENLNEDKFNIPTMILQPIVENAVNHGVFHKKITGKVTLEFIKINNLSYKVSIKDDGIGINKSKEIKENSLQGHDSKSTIIFKERIELLNQSNLWKVDYDIKNLTEDSEFPGTEVNLIFTKK